MCMRLVNPCSGVVGFVRSYGKHLPTESITLNAICPNVVRTNISTNEFYDSLEAQNSLVPMNNVVEAFERCLDTDISGETLEVEPSSIVHRVSKPLVKGHLACHVASQTMSSSLSVTPPPNV